MAIDSSPGNGTTLEVRLPRVADTAPATEPVALRAAGEAILVVDDDPEICRVVRDMLEVQGYRVVTADGAEGVRRVRSGELAPSAAIVDVGAGSGGEALAGELRKTLPGLPVLLMSAYSAGLTPAGTLPIVAKPVSAPTLDTAIRAALDRSRS